MNLENNSIFTDASGLITKKQWKFIEQTLAKTDNVLQGLKRQVQGSGKPQIKLNPLLFHQVTAIDKHYSLLLKCTQIKLNATNQVMTQPYMHQYFCFDMKLYSFPLTLSINKIANNGTLYLGFNQQFPGIYKNLKPNFDPLSQVQIRINKVQDILIQQPGNRNVQKLYLMFSTSKKSLILNFKIKLNSSIKQIPERSLYGDWFKTNSKYSQVMNLTHSKKRKIRIKTQLSPKYSMTKASYLQKIQTMSNFKDLMMINLVQSKFSEQKQKNFDSQELKNATKQLFYKKNGSNLQLKSNGLASMISTNMNFTTNVMSSFLRSTIRFSTEQKLEISKTNIKELEQWREKNCKLKQLVEKFKVEIDTFKKNYDQNRLKQKKLSKKLCILITLNKFLVQTHLLRIKRKRQINLSLKVMIHAKKFIKKLKDQKANNQKLIPKKVFRITYGLLPLTRFLGQSINQRANQSAQKIISKTFKIFFKSLSIREGIQKSQGYISKIKRIQLKYKLKHNEEKNMIKLYCHRNVDDLVCKFKHFSKYLSIFQEQNVMEKLVSQYLKDQNLKVNERTKQYRKQLKERKDYIQVKNKMKDKTKEKSLDRRTSLLKRKNKGSAKQLQIPRLPTKPCKALFRNLNILKSMLRNWFQLQNHIWLKKQKAKLWF